MTLRPSLDQCFPSPLSRQWPATGNPVTCECRQLYALVAICSCVPGAHALVLTEGDVNTQSMAVSMPRGPKYVPFHVTANTTADDFTSFLLRADAAGAAGAPPTAPPAPRAPGTAALGNLSVGGAAASAENVVAAPYEEEDSAFSPASPRGDTALAPSPVAGGGGGGAPASAAAPAPPERRARGDSGRQRRGVVVVCLTGVAAASPSVRSVLMDALVAGRLRGGGGRRPEVPALRVVAFCDYRTFMADLPEAMRAAFALSTCLSSLSQDSAAVLQLRDARDSAVVNKRYMMELCSAADGPELLQTVTLHSSVARYLRHLVLTVRGSTQTAEACGIHLLRRLPLMTAVMRAAAVLFTPEPPELDRPMPGGRAHRSGAVRSSQDAAAAAMANFSSRLGAGASYRHSHGAQQPIDTLDGIVVSPGDVVCMLPALVAHHLAYRSDLVPARALAAAAEGALNAPAPLSLHPQSSGERNAAAPGPAPLAGGGGGGGGGAADPRVWDAHAVLAQPAGGAVGANLLAASTLHSSLLLPADATRVAAAAAAGTAGGGGTGGGLESPRRGASSPGRDARELYLNYREVREVIRATILSRSAPGPG